MSAVGSSEFSKQFGSVALGRGCVEQGFCFLGGSKKKGFCFLGKDKIVVGNTISGFQEC
jgi:hypothetical protein